MKKTGILVMLLYPAMLFCQQMQLLQPVAYSSIAACSGHFTDAFSGSVNQAALAQVAYASAGVYSERRFMLKALSAYQAAIALPSKWGGFGFSLRYLGAGNFNQSQLGIAYGKKLGVKADIGIQFNYNMIRIPGYGSHAALSVEAGLLLHLTEQLHTSIHVSSPAGGRFGSTGEERFASVYSAGFGYEVSDKVMIGLSAGKEESQPVHINTAMIYQFSQQLHARIGMVTGTGNYYAGLGIQWKNFRVDSVLGWQTVLGATPGIMLLFHFHESKPAADREN